MLILHEKAAAIEEKTRQAWLLSDGFDL